MEIDNIALSATVDGLAEQLVRKEKQKREIEEKATALMDRLLKFNL
jgi:hypothetical protein